MNVEYEIISSAIFNRNNLYELLEHNPDIFSDHKAREIYYSLKNLVELNEEICLPAIKSNLISKGKYETIGDGFLAELGTYSSLYNFSYVISNHRREFYKRKITDTAKDLSKQITDDGIDKFVTRVMDIYEEMDSVQNDSCELSDINSANMDTIFRDTNYCKTHIRDLDEIINGFFNGQLIVIAARPKKGKSAIALQIATDINNTVFYSLEMKREELYGRMLSRFAGVESWKIESKRLDDIEIAQVLSARDTIAKYKMKWNDTTNDFNSIVMSIKKQCEKEKPKAIFIDYLQRIRNSRGENQNMRITNITSTLKSLAMQYNIPIVLLSQLNRENEKQNRKPILSDLRDSGSIEQDADIILFLHEDADGKTEIIIAGNRKGKVGTIESVWFNKKYCRFEPKDIKFGDTFNAMGYIHD